jgi:MFS family permease
MKNSSKLLLIGLFKGFYFFVPILTLFLLNKGITLESVVFSQIFYSIFSFLGEIPTGYLADKFGQKTAIVAGYIVDALGIISVFIFPNVISLYLSYAARGIAGSFLSGAEEALLYEVCKEEKINYKKRYSTFVANETLGAGISSIIAGLIIQFFGVQSYSLLFWLTFIFVGICGIIALTLKTSKEVILEEKNQLLKTIINSFKKIKSNETILYLTIATVLSLNGEYFLQGVYQPIFEFRGVEPIFLGLSLSIGSFLNFIFTKYSYKLENILTLDKILLLINLSTGLFYLILALVASPIISVISFIILQGIFNTESPIISDYINMEIPSKVRTTVLSGISFIRSFAQIIVRLILGFLVGMLGVNNTLTINAIYIIVGGFIGYYLLVKCGCVIKVQHEIKD